MSCSGAIFNFFANAAHVPLDEWDARKRSNNEVAVTQKCRNLYLDPSWVQEQKAEQLRSNASRGKEGRERKKKQTHRSFSGPPIFQTIGVISVFIHKKRWRSNRRSINGYKQTISTLKAEERKEMMFVILSLPERKKWRQTKSVARFHKMCFYIIKMT